MIRSSRSGAVRVALGLALLVGVGLVVGSGAATAGNAPAGRYPMVPATAPHQQGRAGVEASVNWAGYAVTGTTFSSVSGSWIQPRATCKKNANQQNATWVGIDGFASTDRTVEQIGTDGDCVKVRGRHTGTPSYYAWFEMFPAATVFLPTSLYPVSPGDALSASVSVSGSTYTLSLTDALKWTAVVKQTPSSPPQNSSAEWITEAPTQCGGAGCAVLQLANFGSLGFTGALANGQPISSPSFISTQINMTNKNGKKPKALTSPLGPGGTSFTVTWIHK
jgi:hypothetical protein